MRLLQLDDMALYLSVMFGGFDGYLSVVKSPQTDDQPVDKGHKAADGDHG